MLFVISCPPQVLLKRGLRKKKRAVDVDVFTRFSLQNNSIIAQKKRKVKDQLCYNEKTNTYLSLWDYYFFLRFFLEW